MTLLKQRRSRSKRAIFLLFRFDFWARPRPFTKALRHQGSGCKALTDHQKRAERQHHSYRAGAFLYAI